MKKLIYLILFVFIIGICPASTQWIDDFFHISKDKEKRMGASIAKKVEKKFDEVDDPLLQKRFEEIGQRIVAVTEEPDLGWHFKVLKAGEGPEEAYFNAFALPGGYAYMFEPLLKMLKTDDKIAAVLAHEIAHITAHHAANRLKKALGVNALMILGLATANSGRDMAEANHALTQLMMSYSREDEFEADRLSVKYMKAAGFDPEGVVGSLEALKKWRVEGKIRRYMYYKSHPYLSERIARARSEIKGYMDFDSYINLPEDKGGFY